MNKFLYVILFVFFLTTSISAQVIDTTMSAVDYDGEIFMLYGDNDNDCYVEFELIDSSKFYVVYEIRGDQYDGAPTIKITLDGEDFMQFNVLDDWFSLTHECFGKTIRFSFINDKWDQDIGDRNIYMKDVSFYYGSSDSLYLNEIDRWNIGIYKCMTDSIDISIQDTLMVGDTLEISFIQPMWERNIETQKDPTTYPYESLLDYFYITPDNSIHNQEEDSLYVDYKYNNMLLLNEGVYAYTVACVDTAGNSSKYSSWKLFYAKAISKKWVPFVPILLKIKTQKGI